MIGTLAELKAWLNIDPLNTDDDAVLTSLLEAATAHAEAFCSASFTPKTETLVVDGKGKPLLPLAAKRVTAVSSVKVDGLTIPQAVGYTSAGWRLTPFTGVLCLQGYVFTKGYGNVEVSYTHGFDEAPDDVKRSVIELAAVRFKERDRIGHSSKSLNGETVAFFTGDLPESVRAALLPYRRVKC